jgi:hypothetical protein
MIRVGVQHGVDGVPVQHAVMIIGCIDRGMDVEESPEALRIHQWGILLWRC